MEGAVLKDWRTPRPMACARIVPWPVMAGSGGLKRAANRPAEIGITRAEKKVVSDNTPISRQQAHGRQYTKQLSAIC